MIRLVLVLVLVLCAVPAIAGEVTLSPAAVVPGGAALLRYHGESPVLAVAGVQKRLIYLQPDSRGAWTLVGADLEQEAGAYTVRIAVINDRGRTEFYKRVLRVRSFQYPEERLSLPPAMVSPKAPEVLQRIREEQVRLRKLFARRTAGAHWQGFRRPVAGALSSPFGLRRILNGRPRSPHGGVDFRSPLHAPVRAAAKGRVVLAEPLYFTGRTVILDHGEGLLSLYAHLDSFACRQDEQLEGGQILGRVGSSGRATGPHLHWGVKLRGNRVDPLELVELLGKSVDSSPEVLR